MILNVRRNVDSEKKIRVPDGFEPTTLRDLVTEGRGFKSIWDSDFFFWVYISPYIYSQIPITRTFRGNRKGFELARVKLQEMYEQNPREIDVGSS